MKQQLRSAAYFIASLGFIGTLPGARIWASFLGIPVLFLGKLSYALSPLLFWGLIASGFVFLATVAFYARYTLTDPDKEETLVLDRALGLVIALVFLPVLTVKYLIFGIVLFHAWIFFSIVMQQLYAPEKKKINLEVILSTGEIFLIGFFTNCLLRFLWWVTH